MTLLNLPLSVVPREAHGADDDNRDQGDDQAILDGRGARLVLRKPARAASSAPGTNAMPRKYVAATNPTKTLTTPPPSATMNDLRSSRCARRKLVVAGLDHFQTFGRLTRLNNDQRLHKTCRGE